MPAARDDYILRLITQAAAAIRRLREMLTGSANSDDVVRDAGAAISELLGPQRGMLELLDPQSAAALLGRDARLTHWVALMRLQADAHMAAGNLDQATRINARAAALEAAAAELGS